MNVKLTLPSRVELTAVETFPGQMHLTYSESFPDTPENRDMAITTAEMARKMFSKDAVVTVDGTTLRVEMYGTRHIIGSSLAMEFLGWSHLGSSTLMELLVGAILEKKR